MPDTTTGGERSIRVGVVGTGFVSRYFTLALDRYPDLTPSRVLTRRPVADVDHPRPDLLTNSLAATIASSDVLVECSGDPVYATDVVARAVDAALPVVTMNAEFHVTAGSFFVGRGLVTEAEGDQPGCLAALDEEARAMGFTPLVYGNMKGFLERSPSLESMEYWASRQGISLPMVTSFTDGTKVQVEQALVANGLGATIAKPDLLGPATDDFDQAARELADAAIERGQPISDYVLSGRLPHGVFIVAVHDQRQTDALRYLKMGDGPYYTLVRNNIFVHLEIAKTIRRAVVDGRGLLDNSSRPTVSVGAVAKRSLHRGHHIDHAIGSFEVRGSAIPISGSEDHVPIGLLANATLIAEVSPGELITFSHVEIPETKALDAWRWTVAQLDDEASRT